MIYLGRYYKAIEYFKKFYALPKEVKDEYIGHQTASQVIGSCLAYLEVSLQDDEETFHTYTKLGDAYQSQINYTEAFKYYDLALQLAKIINYKEGERKAYDELGWCYLNQGNLLKALENFENELKIVNTSRDKMFCLESVARVCLHTGETSKAIEHGEKALTIASEVNEKELEAAVCGTLGRAYTEKGDQNKASEYHNREFKLSSDTGSRVGKARACSNLGFFYRDQAKYYDAIKCHKTALDISTEICSERQHEVTQRLNLASLHVAIGDYSKGVEYYTNSLEISRKIKNRYMESQILRGLAQIRAHFNEWAEADKLSKESLAIALEIGDRRGEMMSLELCGYNKIKLGKN